MPAWFWTTLSILTYLLTAVTIVIVLNRRKEPAAMVAWILTAIFIPVVGVGLFFLLGDPRFDRHVRKRRNRQRDIARALSRLGSELAPMHAARGLPDLDQRLADLIRIATRVGEFPPTRGNEVTLYFDPEPTFLALSLAIQSARHHVHLEYYIFQPDETGAAIRDVIVQKAREGVRCRVLLDAFGTIRVGADFLKPFYDAGVEVAFFLPVRPGAKLLHLNFRNHRKLVVIDGQVAFTGSQNIGDEYLGRKKRFGPWRDTHMRLVGPVARQLQETFVEDWHFAAGVDLSNDDALFPPPTPAGDSIVQVVASGPDRPVATLYMLLLAAVASARRSLLIMTPYFVPDAAMLLALQTAALRGVRVQLLLPTRSDSRVVLWAGRSYYEELQEYGVEIYEYQHGMLHSKVIVVDEEWSVVGSANMDVRSFRINFEVTALLYDARCSAELAADFAALQTRAVLVPPDHTARRRLHETLAIPLARLLSPLL